MTETVAVPVPDNVVVSPPAKKGDKPLQRKATPAGSTAKFKKVLAKLLGTMENLLAADVAAEVDMVEEDDLDSNTPLAQAY